MAFLFIFFFLPFCRFVFYFALSDNSVRPRQHVRRNRQTDLLCGFEIDYKFEFFRLLDGKSAGFAPFQDFVHVNGRATV